MMHAIVMGATSALAMRWQRFLPVGDGELVWQEEGKTYWQRW